MGVTNADFDYAEGRREAWLDVMRLINKERAKGRPWFEVGEVVLNAAKEVVYPK